VGFSSTFLFIGWTQVTGSSEGYCIYVWYRQIADLVEIVGVESKKWKSFGGVSKHYPYYYPRDISRAYHCPFRPEPQQRYFSPADQLALCNVSGPQLHTRRYKDLSQHQKSSPSLQIFVPSAYHHSNRNHGGVIEVSLGHRLDGRQAKDDSDEKCPTIKPT
jgi:hypothetical protein